MGKGFPWAQPFSFLIICIFLSLESCAIYQNSGYQSYDSQAPSLIAKAQAEGVQSPLLDCSPYLNQKEAEIVFNQPVTLQMRVTPNQLTCRISALQANLLARCTISEDNERAQQLLPNLQSGGWTEARLNQLDGSSVQFDLYGEWVNQSQGVHCQLDFPASEQSIDQMKVESEAEALAKLLSRNL